MERKKRFKTQLIPQEAITNKILLLRGKKAMLDRDLARLYGVTTGNLNKAVKRNIERFPEDFMFQLTRDEEKTLSFQIGSLKRGQHPKYLPYVFTEQGVAMLSSVLRSKRATCICIIQKYLAVIITCGFEASEETERRISALTEKDKNILINLLTQNLKGPKICLVRRFLAH